MPALETNLLLLFAVCGVLGAAALFGTVLWKPFGRRVCDYFVTWWERDKRAEAETRRDRERRKAAERELTEACDPVMQETAPVQTAPSSPTVNASPDVSSDVANAEKDPIYLNRAGKPVR